MRALIHRVSRASVTIDGNVVGRIDRGLLVYLGVGHGDGEAEVEFMANKIRFLRIFEDEAGKMNRDVGEAGGAALVVSSFSLYGDARKGRRPAFIDAAPPELANALYERLCERLRGLDLNVETGRFQQTMAVESVNDGPINILLDSGKAF